MHDDQVRVGLAHTQDGLRVYLGQRLLGFIVTRRDGFDAVAAGGAALGRYTSERAAAAALLEAEHER